MLPSPVTPGLVNYLLRVASAFLKLFHLPSETVRKGKRLTKSSNLVLVGHEALRVSLSRLSVLA